jgi:hypothetical protein
MPSTTAPVVTSALSPSATGHANRAALQAIVDRRGEIVIDKPGVYPIAGTVYLDSDTHLRFGEGVVLKKVAEPNPFSHVFLNRNAASHGTDERISIDGLTLQVNNVDVRDFADVFGLMGHVAFYGVRDLRVSRLTINDIGKLQYALHVCRFDNLLVEHCTLTGWKDGIHLGPGEHFHIRQCTFDTFDDAIALNACDWDIGNPEIGPIEDGLIEHCIEHPRDRSTGFFCRMEMGSWCDWSEGMTVQKSDPVVHRGCIYRVRAEPDGTRWRSVVPPDAHVGVHGPDGIRWERVGHSTEYTAPVRRVSFRHIRLGAPRSAFAVQLEDNRFSRSYQPGAKFVCCEDISLAHIRDARPAGSPLLQFSGPVPNVTLEDVELPGLLAHFYNESVLADHGRTRIQLRNCHSALPASDLIRNEIVGKKVDVQRMDETLSESLADS